MTQERGGVIRVRPAAVADRAFLLAAIIELQEHERHLHDTRRPGTEIAVAQLALIEARAAGQGAILVAELEGAPVGFVAGWVEQEEVAAETAESNRFGLIADICVLEPHRCQRIAAPLLEAMEAHLAAAGVTWLRINVLAANAPARAAYARAGYVPYEILHEKRLRPPSLGAL